MSGAKEYMYTCSNSNMQPKHLGKILTQVMFFEKDIVLVISRQLCVKIVLESFGTKPQVENHHAEEERLRKTE